jgi:hypothetical protein
MDKIHSIYRPEVWEILPVCGRILKTYHNKKIISYHVISTFMVSHDWTVPVLTDCIQHWSFSLAQGIPLPFVPLRSFSHWWNKLVQQSKSLLGCQIHFIMYCYSVCYMASSRAARDSNKYYHLRLFRLFFTIQKSHLYKTVFVLYLGASLIYDIQQ